MDESEYDASRFGDNFQYISEPLFVLSQADKTSIVHNRAGSLSTVMQGFGNIIVIGSVSQWKKGSLINL